MDTNLDFKQHIISIQIKLSKIIYMSKKLSTILPKKIHYLMYCIAWNCEEMYTLVIYMK